jgi:hypothetical protein
MFPSIVKNRNILQLGPFLIITSKYKAAVTKIGITLLRTNNNNDNSRQKLQNFIK